MRKSKKKQRNYWKIALISLLVLWLLMFLFSTPKNETEKKLSSTQLKIQTIEKVVQDYNKIHTYSKVDLFVCTDSSIDVWNLVKTEGINAQICVGNVQENLSRSDEFFYKMNHAWVLAETEPFKWLALETTGGFLVWGDENHLYYEGICFDNPSEFKQFLTLRDEYFEVCNEADELINTWNENYVGTILTADAYEFKGRMEAKMSECNEIDDRLVGLIS